jgi:hypothetical protein
MALDADEFGERILRPFYSYRSQQASLLAHRLASMLVTGR